MMSTEHVSVFKEYALSRHYKKNHAVKYIHSADVEHLLANLEEQQGYFT